MTEPSKEPASPIGPDSHVTISYALYEDGKNEPIDMGSDRSPEDDEAGADRFHTRVSYVHGYGLVLPALEKGLEGETAGTTVSVVAEPDEAFGQYEAEAIFEIDREGLEGAEDLAPGDEVLASGPDGDMMMKVVELREESLLVDTNHPLAGKRVRFEVDIIEVRPATDQEIEEAQDDYEDLADGCGCGEPHEGHDHDHGEAHAHEEPSEQLVQLAKKPS